ncbi:MAG TPA: hypothetical protein VKP64_10265, partial [Mycobacteriales bacterium]|nr:hypothetical protein [Mycobacteriales bacterium]
GLIVPATPQLWAAVRGGVLGLLDGEMPVPFQSPRQGTRREIILDRGRVLPAPNERFVVGDRAAAVLGLADDEREITPVDARRAAAMSFRLDRCARRLAELRGDEAGRDVRGEALGSHHPLAETLDEYAETLSEPVDDALAAPDDVSRELAEWRAARARCLAWQLSARVGEGLDRAAGDVKHLEQAELSATPALDPSAVERARRGFLRSTALVAVSLVVALVLVWWHWRPDLGPRWIVRVYATGAVVSLAAVIEALVLAAYYRAHSAFERQLNIRLHRIREAVTAASRVRNEQARLTGMYDQLVTWLAILSQVADGPWSLEQPQVPTYRPCLDPVRLPAALAVATPDEDRKGPRFRERAAAIAVIARPGWLGSAYRELVDIALADLGDDVTYRVDLLDEDGPTSTNRSRRILADALRSGEPQRVLAQRVRDTVAREAFPDNAALVGDSVVPLGADARPCAVSTFLGEVLEPPTAFSQAIWSSEALVGKLQAKSRCVVWAPAALRAAGAGASADGDPDGDPDGGHRQIDRRTVRGHGDGVLSAAMRCDYSPVAPLAYLTLFAATLHPPSPSLSPHSVPHLAPHSTALEEEPSGPW